MYWYILVFFTLGMLGIWLLLVLFTVMVKPKEGDSGGTFQKILKRSGILLLVYVVVIIVGTMLFSYQYKNECGPNPKDVAIMKPMAEKISEYIVKNGVPKSLNDIQGLPYALIGCNKSLENIERCSFYVGDSKYNLRIYKLIGRLNIKIKSKITKTGIYYDFKKNDKQDEWDLVKEKIYSSKNTGICNPMRM